MRYYWENLPLSLQEQREVLYQVMEAMAQVRPLQRVILFGSHVRGEAGSHSDVDLCIVAEGAEEQIQTAIQFRRQLRDIVGRPALTLLPISPRRWQEKQASRDPFFQTIAREGKTLAEND
jgi:predicted nucleotidyltransferase